MQTTGTVTAFHQCDGSVKVLTEHRKVNGDLLARTTRIILDVDGSGSVARQKLLEQVVISIEAYSRQLGELTDAFTALSGIDPAFQTKKVLVIDLLSDMQESRDLILYLPPPDITGAPHD